MKVSYCEEERDPKSSPSPREGWSSQASCPEAAELLRLAVGPRETSRCGRELGGRVLVSWESAEDEKFVFQDANPQEKQDSLVCCLQETFRSCSHRIFSSSMEAQFLSGSVVKTLKRLGTGGCLHLLLAMAKAFYTALNKSLNFSMPQLPHL